MMTKQQKIWIDDASQHLEGATYIDFKCGARFWYSQAKVLEDALEKIVSAEVRYSVYAEMEAREALRKYRGEK